MIRNSNAVKIFDGEIDHSGQPSGPLRPGPGPLALGRAAIASATCAGDAREGEASAAGAVAPRGADLQSSEECLSLILPRPILDYPQSDDGRQSFQFCADSSQ